MDSMENVIKQHNRKIRKTEPVAQNQCDFRNKASCPLEKNCRATNVVYSAVVSHTDRRERHVSKTYIGVTEPEFKKRYNVHVHTFNNRGTPNDTSLSKYIWNLKDKGNTGFQIKWSILQRAPGYNKTSKTCGLCFTEHLLKNCKPG